MTTNPNGLGTPTTDTVEGSIPSVVDLIYRLRKRAEIRRKIPRGEPDRISDLLEEAANELEDRNRRPGS